MMVVDLKDEIVEVLDETGELTGRQHGRGRGGEEPL